MRQRVLIITVSLLLLVGVVLFARAGLRAQGKPKPFTEVMQTIKRVGDEIGQGITNAANKGAEGVKKAGRKVKQVLTRDDQKR